MKQVSKKELLHLIFNGFTLIAATLIFVGCQPNNTGTTNSIGQEEFGNSENIIGGAPVSSTDSIAQSTVILLDTQKGGLCTGNLVAKNLILTAAHCTQLHSENILVVFSRKMFKSVAELNKMVTRRVIGGKTSASWPNLDAQQDKNWGDIALLKFSGDLPAGYKAISILTHTKSLVNGLSLTLAGYGYTNGATRTDTDVLRKVSVRISDANFSESEILIDQRAGKGACHGDSGGPAIAKINSADVLVGLTSRGENDPADNCRGFSVYTSVAAHSDWIQKTSEELSAANFRGGLMPQPAGID